MTKLWVGFWSTVFGAYMAGGTLYDMRVMPSGGALDEVAGPILVFLGVMLLGVGVIALRRTPEHRLRASARATAYVWVAAWAARAIGADTISFILLLSAGVAAGWMTIRAIWAQSPSARAWMRARLED
jgi:hypothetical protein